MTGSVRGSIAIGVAMAVLLEGVATTNVHAQPSDSERAEELFRRGKELMAQGKTAEACAAFDESQRLDPDLSTVMNQANCREQNGQLATAFRLFREAVRQTQGSADEATKQLGDTARDRLRDLEPRLSTIQIVVPEDHRLPGLVVKRGDAPVPPATWNQTEPVDGGSYTITATAPGHDSWSTTVTIAVARDTRRVEVPELALEGTQSAALREGSRVWSKQRAIAVGVAAIAIGSGIAGALYGRSAQDKEQQAKTLCPDPMLACRNAMEANDLVSTGRDHARNANIAFGIAGGTLVLAGVLWFTGAPESPRRLAVVPRASTDAAGVVIVGRF